jgi:ABC-type transporter Mla MlaB component
MTNASITLKKLKGGTVRYIFNNEISIKTVLAQREIVLGSLKYSKKIYLNMNRVTKIDSAGLQLLYLIKLEAKRRDIEINIGENSKLLIQLLPKLKLVGDLSCHQALG